MSNFTEFAKKELEIAGLFDDDSDYSGMIGDAVMELIEKFSEQGHSGMSASMTAYIFNQLTKWNPLTTITNDPSEWTEVAEQLWQSKRKSSCFSKDGGKTHYDIDERLSKWQRLAFKLHLREKFTIRTTDTPKAKEPRNTVESPAIIDGTNNNRLPQVHPDLPPDPTT